MKRAMKGMLKISWRFNNLNCSHNCNIELYALLLYLCTEEKWKANKDRTRIPPPFFRVHIVTTSILPLAMTSSEVPAIHRDGTPAFCIPWDLGWQGNLVTSYK